VTRALISGCGDLGTEVGLLLAAEGYEVHGLRRNPEVLPAPIRPVAGDLTTDDGLADVPSDVDLLVHTPTAGGRDPEAYAAVYRYGMVRLLDHLAAGGGPPRRTLFVSSTTVYGDADGGWVDEDTPTDPDSATGKQIVAAERALLDAGVDGVVLRLAGIYGPGRTRLIDQVRAGEAVRPDPPRHANRIHRDDAARAVVHLLTAPEVAPIYLGVDDAPVDRGEVVAFLAQELGLPTPPRGPASGRGGDKRCRNDRLRGTGFTLRYPTYREGYRAVLAGEGVRHP
jgi:nucleoside-diphosphate-sugar epimerase